jgi:hypothetical protein
MGEIWKAFWPILERLETEFCDLSFSVAICDDQLRVHSSRLADLLVRSCVECENAGKSLCAENALVPNGDNFPGILDAISLAIAIETKELIVIWPFQSLTNTVVRPFGASQRRTNENPPWFKAYNAVKHDRMSNATEATLENVLHALGGLFILNLRLREKDITSDSDDVNVMKRRATSYSRLFSPARFLQPASADGISVSGGASTRLRNLEFHWK